MKNNKIIVPLNAENQKRNSNSINNSRIIFGIILFMIIPYIMMHNSNKRYNTNMQYSSNLKVAANNKKTKSSEEILRSYASGEKDEEVRKQVELEALKAASARYEQYRWNKQRAEEREEARRIVRILNYVKAEM